MILTILKKFKITALFSLYFILCATVFMAEISVPNAFAMLLLPFATIVLVFSIPMVQAGFVIQEYRGEGPFADPAISDLGIALICLGCLAFIFLIELTINKTFEPLGSAK